MSEQFKIKKELLTPLYTQNPDLDILNFDFYDKNAISKLKKADTVDSGTVDTEKEESAKTEEAYETEKTHQRLLRVEAHEAVAKKLIDKGLTSAHHIAALAEHQFVRDHADAFDGDEERTRKAYQKAVHIKTKVQHVYGAVKDMVASPYYKATSFANTDAEIDSYFQGIPSYQKLFGSLDYLECEHCQSIFSQSAYFVNIMQIVDKYITDPNTKPNKTIPEGYTLEERRPDLFNLSLTCENIVTTIPYLEVVNDVIEKHIAKKMTNGAFNTLAVAGYPFNLPFNLPLVETRTYLDRLKTSLASIYKVLIVPERTDDSLVKEIDVARESLGLSMEEYGLITKADSSEDSLKRYYGYTNKAQDLVENLKVVETFLKRTNLDHDRLQELFTQELTSQEQTLGVANKFFINKTGETGLEYLHIDWDKTNRDHPIAYIKGLSLKRLDRLNRFIRLAEILGWSYADLDWALASYGNNGADEITGQAIAYLAKIKVLLNSTKLSLDVLTSFWHPMKTIGKRKPHNPQDLFDRVFNNPLLLDGQNPYNSTTVPFNPNRSPIQEWQVVDTTGENGILRNRLKAALMLNDGDLTTLGNYLLKLLEITTGKLPLNLDNLTWLYRLSKQSTLFELTIDEYLNLLCLMHYPEAASYLSPQKNAVPASIEEFIKLKEIVDWIAKSSLNIYELKYIITGKSSNYFKPEYKSTDIKPFIQGLAVTAEGSRLNPGALIFENIDTEKAAEIFQKLVASDFITDVGIFLKKITGYQDKTSLFPLSKASFHTPTNSITESESEAVLTALGSQSPPVVTIRTGEKTGTLSSSINAQTNLDFLKSAFTGSDNDKALKIGKVKTILLQVQRNINHTADVLQKTELLQETNLLNGLSDFLNYTIESLRALLPYAMQQSQLTHYLQTFLTPMASGGNIPDNDKVEKFLETLARWSLLVTNIPLTQTETEAVISGAKHFNIADLNKLTLNDVRSLTTFKSLVKSFGSQKDALLAYFKINKQSKKTEKLEALADITGWKTDEIDTLIDLFWPASVVTSADYDTVAGLLRLKNVFDVGRVLGCDVSFLSRLSSLSHLPVADTSGSINAANWTTYSQIAAATLQVVNAKYKDTEFTQVYKSITDELNTRKRDVLLPYAIWSIHKTDPSIERPSDLYKYLLIDVETSSSTTTSKIAQGIASVQLYMQRCRMMLEPGVNTIQVPEIWWRWISEYRVWEVNRKIFLYPENYIEPSLRKGSTPEFEELANALLQTKVTKETVVAPYQQYFKQVSILGSLIHTSSYHCTRIDPNTGEEKDTLFIFGRTNTVPYTYYFRALENGDDWTPWEEIKLTIGASNVTPVYGFGRLFIFWTELDTGKSGTISNTSGSTTSNTQTVYKATIKYSFYNFITKEWVHPQTLLADVVINAFPNPYLSDVLGIVQIVGSGTVSITSTLTTVTGKNTQFEKEVQVGDWIWCGGEVRSVGAIADDNNLAVSEAWNQTLTNAKYEIIHLQDVAKIVGSGTVSITSTLTTVTGKNTQFEKEVQVGDRIWCGGEVRTVGAIADDNNLAVPEPWNQTLTNAKYKIIPHLDENLADRFDVQDPYWREPYILNTGEGLVGSGTVSITSTLTTVTGKNTQFEKEVQVGDRIWCGGEVRTVGAIADDNNLAVPEPWNQTLTNAKYKIIP
ncbi:MAG: hypothetical protein F6K40_00565, partial [Okeania sp. SIO3I5]|uniref:neuraminidase-like domain-containing protein n=1 Tax=Okeania sp. SIO3I5 TaxID=2607805 RepID=UPI0013BD0F8B